MDHRLLLSRQGLCRTLSFWSESRTRGQGKGAGHPLRAASAYLQAGHPQYSAPVLNEKPPGQSTGRQSPDKPAKSN